MHFWQMHCFRLHSTPKKKKDTKVGEENEEEGEASAAYNEADRKARAEKADDWMMMRRKREL